MDQNFYFSLILQVFITVGLYSYLYLFIYIYIYLYLFVFIQSDECEKPPDRNSLKRRSFIRTFVLGLVDLCGSGCLFVCLFVSLFVAVAAEGLTATLCSG